MFQIWENDFLVPSVLPIRLHLKRQTDGLLNVAQSIVPGLSQLTAPEGLAKEKDKRPIFGSLLAASCDRQYLNQVSQPRRYWRLGLDHLFLQMLSCVWRLFSSISSLYPQDASTVIPTMITLAVSRLCQITSWGREGQSHPPPIESLWSTLGEPTSDSKI